MLRRLFPHPLLTLLLVVVWMLLANSFSWGSLVFAIILGLVIPALTAPYWPDRPMIRSVWRLFTFTLLVIWDIVIANIEVARIVLFKPNRDLRPAWISIPLDLRTPEAITVLAGTITLTPGTVSCDLSEDGSYLLVHCLHAPDPDAVVDDIKKRYESRLKEIFA